MKSAKFTYRGNFRVYGIEDTKHHALQCFICNIILALGLISGATALSANARDVSEDYIDETNCDDIQMISASSTEVDETKEQCDYFDSYIAIAT